MLTRDEALGYCQTLLSHFVDRLSEWEDTFVRDVRLQLQGGRDLTEKQSAVLDRLMERCAQQHGKGG